MKQYIANILPRIKQFSSDLSKKEIFVDKSWVILDEELNKQTYIFRRNGKLIMSYNGKAEVGSWEYIPEAKSLFIDRLSDKLLLNQGFVDQAIMVLKKDDLKENNFLILIDQNEISDLDVKSYLLKKYEMVVEVVEQGGEKLEIYNGYVLPDGTYSYFKDKKVTINGIDAPDGIYWVTLNRRATKLEILNGIITEVYLRREYSTKHGQIFIDETSDFDNYYSVISRGNKVYDKEGNPAKDGKYRLSIFKSILVKNGEVV